METNNQCCIGKLFFLQYKGRRGIVYCYNEDEEFLYLRGVSQFINDAKGNTVTQDISREKFGIFNPQEIDESRLDKYNFLEKFKKYNWDLGYKLTGKITWSNSLDTYLEYTVTAGNNVPVLAE